MPATRVGPMFHRVTLWRGPKVTDDSDGFFEPLDPLVWWCSIEPLAPQEEMRMITSVVTMRWHPRVTVDTRIVDGDDPRVPGARQLIVKGIQDVNNAHVTLRMLCEEIAPL
jgi:head-tail adaptor